jgi:glutamate N-acetyltransferase/amino-acid N-acetyltransferase
MTRIPLKSARGGITAPKGFTAAGVHCGIKKARTPDLALVVSECHGPIAGLFTTNRVQAAPVLLNRAYLKQGIGRAFFVNSGNANAFTGPQGMADAREMAFLAAQTLRTPVETIFVGSTGVISNPLPMPAIRQGLPAVVRKLRKAGGHEAAQAIMTTDLKAKEVAYSAKIGGRTITVGGMAKGSGMIHPDMATMLAYITTDAAIEQPTLQQALAAATAQSFNCISVDGDTSTNDTVLCLANGLAGNPVLCRGSHDLAVFQHLLNTVCLELAMKIIWDGEGVTRVVRFDVTGGATEADARQVAKTIGTSLLVKTALFGADANWGRIVAAAGRAGVAIDPERLSLSFDHVAVVKSGRGLGQTAQKKIDRLVKQKAFTVTLDLGQGKASARLWTTDLSHEYVRINASYRS